MAGEGDVRAALGFMSAVPDGPAVFDRVLGALRLRHDDVLVRTTGSQVAFWRRRGFAYLWLPGRHLTHPRTDIALSFALPNQLASPRFAQVVKVSKTLWMHHLDVNDPTTIDDQVLDWLEQAATKAG